jgi:hypothetical protein
MASLSTIVMVWSVMVLSASVRGTPPKLATPPEIEQSLLEWTSKHNNVTLLHILRNASTTRIRFADLKNPSDDVLHDLARMSRTQGNTGFKEIPFAKNRHSHIYERGIRVRVISNGSYLCYDLRYVSSSGDRSGTNGCEGEAYGCSEQHVSARQDAHG